MRMTLAEREARTCAFEWAWERLEGWGQKEGPEFKKLSFDDRIKDARRLAAFAIYAPIFGDMPGDISKDKRKRWPAIEEAEREQG